MLLHMIQGSLSCMYQWTLRQDPDTIAIEIMRPYVGFDVESIHSEISEMGDEIRVGIKNVIPLVEGVLFETVTSFEMIVTASTVSVVLAKKVPGDWPILIKKARPVSGGIDPKSAFDLSERAAGMEKKESEALLQFSVNVGYVPAMMAVYHSLVNGDETEQMYATELLVMAAKQMEDPVAMIVLGDKLARRKDTMNEAFSLYANSAGKGSLVGMSLMGRLISPLSGVPFHYKNGSRAAELFEKVLAKMDEPIAMIELSKLLKTGVGVTKDVARSKALKARADELEALSAGGSRNAKFPAVISFYRRFAISAFACAGAYVLYRVWRSRRK